MSNYVRDWFRATERCNISHLNRLKDQVNIEATTTWNMNNEEVSFVIYNDLILVSFKCLVLGALYLYVQTSFR